MKTLIIMFLAFVFASFLGADYVTTLSITLMVGIITNYATVPLGKSSMLMALVKWGLPAAVSGKIGGVVASINNRLRIWAKPVNPQTQPQQNQRGVIAVLSQAWRALTEPQRQSWISLTAEVTKFNALAQQVKLSGNALFNSFGATLTLFDISANSDAPVLQGTTQITSLSFVADASAHTAIITGTHGNTNVNDGFVLEATPQMSPGRYFAKNQFRVLVTDEDLDAAFDSFPFGDAYEAMFGTLQAGKKIFIRVRPANIVTGQTGIALEASSIVVT